MLAIWCLFPLWRLTYIQIHRFLLYILLKNDVKQCKKDSDVANIQLLCDFFFRILSVWKVSVVVLCLLWTFRAHKLTTEIHYICSCSGEIPSHFVLYFWPNTMRFIAQVDMFTFMNLKPCKAIAPFWSYLLRDPNDLSTLKDFTTIS